MTSPSVLNSVPTHQSTRDSLAKPPLASFRKRQGSENNKIVTEKMPSTSFGVGEKSSIAIFLLVAHKIHRRQAASFVS